MNLKFHGWFTECSPMWPGQAFSLKINKLIFDKKSQYQHIQIYETEKYGRMLVLDGAIQLTERDEASYQEMLAFLPLNSHPNPEKVLVIGGGDGGILREVAKHPAVKEIVMCEIDDHVVAACKEHIPSLASGFSDPRVTLHFGDGMEFLGSHAGKFDVIITDASDPVVPDDDEAGKDGPAATLFNDAFYARLHEKLNPEGVLACQGESMWLHKDLIKGLMKKSRELYPVVEYAYTCTPSYPCGQIGFILCSKNPTLNLRVPVTKWTSEEVKRLKLKYYNTDIHSASFVLPTFMTEFLSSD
ncbi:spermidine synthase-like [Hyalella azteca]|uniref:Spermidine synthase-like n=1 Tax=Hyalella azteca TaxID=294128 RepID=A0A8B7PD08_HYAAZ|nr:spermidine synthase-like [Hyalella azteca]